MCGAVVNRKRIPVMLRYRHFIPEVENNTIILVRIRVGGISKEKGKRYADNGSQKMLVFMNTNILNYLFTQSPL